jgi:purine-binding chemotaxis protein CheW
MESQTCQAAQYLTFRLDREQFAVDIAKVREVLEFTRVTKVPGTPEFMRGVINLRGNVVPVVDMRLKLGLPQTERTVDTCVIITEVVVDGERVVLGALVDSVQEVLDLDGGQIAAPPHIGQRIDESAVHGMGKRGDEFVIILDIDKVFPSGDLKEMREQGRATAAG